MEMVVYQKPFLILIQAMKSEHAKRHQDGGKANISPTSFHLRGLWRTAQTQVCNICAFPQVKVVPVWV